jgi:hypothetical protein
VKAIKWIGGIVGALILLLFVSIEIQVYYDKHPETAQDRKARIVAACQAQFVPNSVDDYACRNRLLLKYLNDNQADKMKAAEDAAQ